MKKNKLGAKRQAQEERTAEIVRQGGTWNARHILPRGAALDRIVAKANQGKKGSNNVDDPAQVRMEDLQ